jgi:hypothetical protein
VVLVGAAVLALGVGLSACDSGGGNKAGKKAAVATPPTTAPPTLTGMNVNLVVTGDQPATIQGSKGTCRFPATGLPNTYQVVAADYPQLGSLGSIGVWGPTAIGAAPPIPPTVKMYRNTLGFMSAVANGGITVSADGRRVDVDTDLYGASGGSVDGSLVDPTWTLHGHITGSIRCK